ncbi:MAG TPA: PAS domain-containing protein [Caulobacteraceae bacterium]|jgi:DNA-binding CsgD family transcriptional regulator/PAS domain-containing protein
MANEEDLSELIGAIYDAALDEALWPAALGRICGFVGGTSATLFAQDAALSRAVIYHQCGADPTWRQAYLDTYARLNPGYPAAAFIEVGRVFSVYDIMTAEEWRQTRFWREYVRPQGWADAVSVNLDRSTTSAAMLAVARGDADGLVDDGVRRRIGLVFPHVRRAVLVGKVIDLGNLEGQTLAAAMDALADIVILVAAGGRIIHANAAARQVLERGDILRNVGGVLAAGDVRAGHELREAISACGSGDVSLRARGLAIALASRDGAQDVAHVMPLTSGARREIGAAWGAVAAVCVRRAALDTPSPAQVLARRHKLTAGEIRVLLAAVDIGGVAPMAQALGLTQATVKTHLHHLFQKTGARRQADLVKLLAASASPIAG